MDTQQLVRHELAYQSFACAHEGNQKFRVVSIVAVKLNMLFQDKVAQGKPTIRRLDLNLVQGEEEAQVGVLALSKALRLDNMDGLKEVALHLLDLPCLHRHQLAANLGEDGKI